MPGAGGGDPAFSPGGATDKAGLRLALDPDWDAFGRWVSSSLSELSQTEITRQAWRRFSRSERRDMSDADEVALRGWPTRASKPSIRKPRSSSTSSARRVERHDRCADREARVRLRLRAPTRLIVEWLGGSCSTARVTCVGFEPRRHGGGP
jgi:hypothetical protein